MRFLYIATDFFAVFLPLVFSFHSKIKFYRYWKSFIAGLSIVASLFILWDIVFTKWGVWGFNPMYVSGIYFANLPVEEVLFFFCIPFSCLFTFYNIEKSYPQLWTGKIQKPICLIISFLLIIYGLAVHEKRYTMYTFILSTPHAMTISFNKNKLIVCTIHLTNYLFKIKACDLN
jgi:lycopene cyclase domain-containing protein